MLECSIRRIVLSIVLCGCCVVFFFQAEDGIRDLVRSRGLGDVYKRQSQRQPNCFSKKQAADVGGCGADGFQQADFRCALAVSYTHLTLPTSDLV